MPSPGPERAESSRQVGDHVAWAMAIGGMIGGGVYTLAGVILGLAGPLAWLSLVLGCLVALATANSYARLALTTCGDAVPISVYSGVGQRGAASVLAWGLLLVYVLSLAVYTFTVGHYFGRALGFSPGLIAVFEIGVVGILVALNARRIEHPAVVQVIAVWIELAVLGALAVVGFLRWDPENLTRGVPGPSVAGVLVAMATTFIAFEGFEMLVYDVKDVRRPRRVLRVEVPRAVITVGFAYAIVTMGAASLVGADVLVRYQENSLAIAGAAAAGTTGLVVVTIAACASAISAINATLFSVARLARTTAQRGLLPVPFARSNVHGAPVLALLVIGAVALVVAISSSLEPLVAAASLGFLALFLLVNVLALQRLTHGRWIAMGGAVGAGGAALIVVARLVTEHPFSLAILALLVAIGGLTHVAMRRARHVA